MGAEEGAIESIPGKEGRIAQAWVNVRGGLCIFSVYFWHSEGWSSRNEALLEAVLKRTRTTKHPWLIACHANMSPEDFEKSLWFRKEQTYVVAPEGVSTCRSRSVNAAPQKGIFSDMQVMEDFESRPHRAVTFVVQRGKAGMEREKIAEGVTWMQRRKTTRKKHKREM